MLVKELFDEDYFERGVEKKVSGYTSYSYIPTRSFEEASTLLSRWDKESINWVEGDLCFPNTVLDFGCAKGYLVHALRQLGFNAWGYDPSEYAISNAHPRALSYVINDKFLLDNAYDYVICKDVMEHVPENEVLDTLKFLCSKTRQEALFVIPLGDDNKFRIREYEMDITHVTKKGEDWWIDKLLEAGFEIVDFKYKFGDIKKKWQGFDYGNGFFFVRVKE